MMQKVGTDMVILYVMPVNNGELVHEKHETYVILHLAKENPCLIEKDLQKFVSFQWPHALSIVGYGLWVMGL